MSAPSWRKGGPGPKPQVKNIHFAHTCCLEHSHLATPATKGGWECGVIMCPEGEEACVLVNGWPSLPQGALLVGVSLVLGAKREKSGLRVSF